MKSFTRFLFIALIAMAASCTCITEPYTMDDNGSTVNLSMDDPFEVSLRANGSTGYQWIILPYDETVIEQIGEPEFKADDDRIGSGGMQTYKFKTVGEGSTELKMVYKKRWEDPKPEDKTFELKVVCGTMGRILEE